MLAALADPADPELAVALRDAVASIAGRWAVRTAARGLAFVSSRVDGAAVEGAVAFEEPSAEQLPDALEAALAGHSGPVLLVAPDVPGLDPALAADALEDLAEGCALAFAPASDARAFLVALARPAREMLELVAARDKRRDELLAVALQMGGEVGLLRSERRLVTPADARALALDPLAPPELRALLR